MPDAPVSAGYGTVSALLLVIAISVWIGTAAQRVVNRSSFMKSYFLGNRGLGVWAMALTATVQSGGTFMGVPSLIYSHGWIVALWIGSYMVVPLTGFAVLGKRLAQISRRSGALTVPELFRGRFDNPTVGLIASLLVMLFLSFMMIAQFKAGALVMKLSIPGTEELELGDDVQGKIDTAYYIGLAVFSFTVVGYTLIGGFLASVWTDLFQSVLMWCGVVLLLVLVLTSPQVGSLEYATQTAVQNTGPGFATIEGFAKDGRSFLPMGLACSMFFVWIFGGMASPASITRVMATDSTATLRRSIFVLAAYNMFIYIPLICICIAARVIMPAVPKADEIIPRMTLWATQDLPGGSFIAGLILSAPFGAVMATVSTCLVVIASGLIRDVYQRFLFPNADEAHVRRATHGAMIVLGIVCVAANIHPVEYLQALVVFGTSGGAASFLVPAMMTAYWRRATAQGTIAAMLCGAGTVLTLFIIGVLSSDPQIGQATKFRPYFLGGLEPMVWGLAASALAGVVVSLLTPPPKPELVSKFFDAPPAK
jgi:SSS family solute:Na+ symporter/sodium/pantothenate symporter